MTPWYVISAVGWVAWMWAARNLLREYAHPTWRPSGLSGLLARFVYDISAVLMIGAPIIRAIDTHSAWQFTAAAIGFLALLVAALEAGYGMIFWSKNRWLRPLRRWCYAND